MIPKAALPALIFLFATATGTLHAQLPSLRISLSGDDVMLSFSSAPESYYILRSSTDLDSIGVPIGMTLGSGLSKTLVDTGILAVLPARGFYRLELVPRDTPKDTDGDGIDDVAELEFTFLDPLDPADAPLDFDEDGFANDRELNDYGTNPAVLNASVFPPRILGLSFQAAKETLEIAGLQVGAVTCVPTIHQPAAAVINPDLSPYVALPAGAAIDLTISLPFDANLFINQLSLTPFDGTEANAQAYYAAVDPFNDKMTLGDWIASNNFGGSGGTEAHAAYFNEADLGFGRRMFMRRDASGISYYTVNYASADEAAQGTPTDIATVCMEYSPHPRQGGDPYVKFFTYNGNHPDPSKRADPTAGPGARLTKIDLDGRGAKFQPGNCMTCHGGLPRQLDNGVYPELGRTGARFIPFDIDSFTYPTLAGFTRTEQEPEFKKLNAGILASIPEAKRFTFTGQVDIPDADLVGVDIPLTVSGFQGNISDLSFSFDGAGPCSTTPGDRNNGLNHTSLQDLVVTLSSPGGTTVTLLNRQFPINAHNLCRMQLDDETDPARLPATAALADAPYPGLWRPFNPLSTFDGEDPNGIWTLHVSDQSGLEVGSVNQWSLHITPTVRGGAISELLEGWYGGPALPGDFNENFVPAGWLTPASLAEGGDVVYSDVVAKSCRACHVQLTDRRPDLDFASYDEFAARRAAVKNYVFERGQMPMAKRTFDKFWASTGPSQAEVLAEWIDAPNRVSYTGPAELIPDFGTGSPATMQLTVAGFTGLIEDLDFSFDGTGPCSRIAGDTNNGLTHPFVSDLTVTLTSPPPNSTSVRILDRVGGRGTNFCDMRLDDEVQISLAGVTSSQSPYVGSWKPGNTLSAFDGRDPNGIWTLTVEDHAAQDTGSVQNWSLHFNSLGATTGPGIPIAVINAPITIGGVTSVPLDGTGSLFADTYEWTLTTPSGTIFGSTSANASLEFVAQGTYTVKLTVRNAFGKDVTTRDITLVNEAPVITTLTATSPLRFPAAATLRATSIDDNLPIPPGTLSYLWEKASGPGEVDFGDATQDFTDATFSKPGTYVLGFTVSDSELNDTGQVTVMVEDGMVTIGDAGNLPDPATGLGAVAYEYRIGACEVTNAQYAAFLNATAATTDPYALFHPDMDAHADGGIARTGAAPSFSYSTKSGRSDWPVNFMSFFDAVRYVNWLHNGAAPGGDTEDGAYTLLGGSALPGNGETVTRNPAAKFWIPSDNEWYKAAYHQPAANGGDTDHYWTYATGSNTLPSAGPPPGTPPAANYNDLVLSPFGLAPVGSYIGSESYYGTADQAGNVWEVMDTIVVFGGDFGSGRKAGGPGAMNTESTLAATDSISPWFLDWTESFYGFRIAGALAGTGGNIAPSVSAGSDVDHEPATLPTVVTLTGTTSDDGLPAPPTLTTTWTQISGPTGASPVVFTNPNNPDTTATFPQHGDYVLRLTANDGELTNFDEVTIRVLVSFEDDIVPMLTVPSGTCLTCHNDGFASGGLSLAVNGSTPKSCQEIYTALSPGSGSLRLNTSNPESSRLLVYPAQGSGGSMPTISGFELGSANYKKVLLWIQQGAPNDCGP